MIKVAPYLKSKKTHCINGHPFTKENSYYSPKGYRACRKCKLDAMHRLRNEMYEQFGLMKAGGYEEA